MSDEEHPSIKVRSMADKVRGTKALMLMVSYDQIERHIGAEPPDIMLGMSINQAIGAEAMRDTYREHPAETLRRLTAEDMQKFIDATEMLEHTVACLKEVIQNGQH